LQTLRGEEREGEREIEREGVSDATRREKGAERRETTHPARRKRH
jgi:hypothetical protein